MTVHVDAQRTAYRGTVGHAAHVLCTSADTWPAEYRVNVTLGDRGYSGGGSDAFEALWACRRALEVDGLLLGVEGAGGDVWPSAMARDQGGGLRAYRLRLGRAAEPRDLVDVFAPAHERLTTTAAHAAAAERWLRRPRLSRLPSVLRRTR